MRNQRFYFMKWISIFFLLRLFLCLVILMNFKYSWNYFKYFIVFSISNEFQKEVLKFFFFHDFQRKGMEKYFPFNLLTVYILSQIFAVRNFANWKRPRKILTIKYTKYFYKYFWNDSKSMKYKMWRNNMTFLLICKSCRSCVIFT